MTSILKSRCFSEQAVKELNLIFKTLLKNKQISVFEYARVYNDGTAFILYTDPKISKFIVENEVHITAHVSPNLIGPSFWYLPDSHGPYSFLLKEIRQIGNSGGFVDFIRRHKGYFEMFCFWSNLDQSDASNHFITIKEILEQFCYRFLDKSQKLIEEVNNDRFKIPEAMAPNIRGLETHENLELPRPSIDFHLSKIKQNFSALGKRNYPAFTNQEIACANWLLLGKTSQEIATKLDLSRRTAEMHLDSLRQKLDCAKKSQIIEKMIWLDQQ